MHLAFLLSVTLELSLKSQKKKKKVKILRNQLCIRFEEGEATSKKKVHVPLALESAVNCGIFRMP